MQAHETKKLNFSTGGQKKCEIEERLNSAVVTFPVF